MGTVRVDPERLAAGATRCDGWAAELSTTSIAQGPGLPGQATAAAVTTADVGAASAGAAMAARMQATAAKMVASSNAYVYTDGASAENLNAVADSVQV